MRGLGLFGMLIILLSITSCILPEHRTESTNSNIYCDFEWLQGTWEQQSTEGTLLETWKMLDDSTFVGTGTLVQNADTLFSEKLSLYKSMGNWNYSAMVPDQNEGAAVVFELVSADASKWTFENKTHDFPQQIIYHHVSDDSLVALVKGEVEGTLRTEIFKMKRSIK